MLPLCLARPKQAAEPVARVPSAGKLSLALRRASHGASCSRGSLIGERHRRGGEMCLVSGHLVARESIRAKTSHCHGLQFVFVFHFREELW